MNYVTDAATKNTEQKTSKMYKLFLLTALGTFHE